MMAFTVPWCEPGFDMPWMETDSSDSDEELVLLYEVGGRSEWVHRINKRREQFGEYHHLMADLECDDEKFRTYYRLNKEEFSEVLSLISSDIKKKDTNYRKAITPSERLAICLRFLSSGDTYQSIAFSYRVGLSTVSKIVDDVCYALWKNMQPLYMPTPDENLWRNVARGFNDRWNFPHCIGAIDGKHVKIQCPPFSGSCYYNYKQYYSSVLLGLVDAEYKFVFIDVGSYGKECDSTIFLNSTLGQRMASYSLSVPADEPLVTGGVEVPYVLVGDEGFPMQRYLMRPYPRKNLNDEKRVYNYRVSRCRRVVENAFGILAQRWRLYFRPLQCKIDSVHKIIKATVILHNYLSNKGNITAVGTPEEIKTAYQTCWKPAPKCAAEATKEQVRIRNKFVDYFNSPEGSVAWQWKHTTNNK